MQFIVMQAAIGLAISRWIFLFFEKTFPAEMFGKDVFFKFSTLLYKSNCRNDLFNA